MSGIPSQRAEPRLRGHGAAWRIWRALTASRAWLATAAAAATAVVVALVLTSLLTTRNVPGESAPPPGDASSAAPVAPAHGAYVGAWVGPAVDTPPGRIAAVDALQRQIGRRLDIVHDYYRWRAHFPTRSDLAFMRRGSMLLLSWAGTDTRAIASGAYDGWIRRQARAIKAVGKPIFLEWRWEMDRPNLRAQVGSPADFIAAWKRIHSVFGQEQVDNVAWVWCPTADGFSGGYAQAYYPGDDQVNWICADAYPGWGPYRSFADIVAPFLRWASHRPKPVMIGEFGVPQSYPPQQRAQWLLGAERIALGDPQIKAMVYFDANSSDRVPAYSFGLQGNDAALRAFRGIADDRYFNPRRVRVSGRRR